MGALAKFWLCRFPRLYQQILRLKKPQEYHSERIVFLSALRNGDVVFDVGANRGNYTLFFSNIVGRGGEVHAFEPIPGTFERLRARVLKSKHFDNVRLNNVAAGETSGSFTFNMPDNDDGQASMTRHTTGSWLHAKEISSHQCEVTTLDLYAAALSRPPAFIKCDVEGAELLALKGAEGLLMRHRPMLFLEVCKDWLANFGTSPAALLNHVRARGYDMFFRIDEQVTRLRDAEMEFEKAAWPGSIDLLCANSEMHAERLVGL